MCQFILPVDNPSSSFIFLSNTPTIAMRNIPVNTEYYENKNVLKIEAYDNFRILKKYYSEFGITSYNLINIDTFLQSRKKKLQEIFKTDMYQKELFYYSFIYLYWPMITEEVFSIYIKYHDKWKEYFPELNPDINTIKKKILKE